MIRGRQALVAGLLAGALLRACLLPLPGTGDVTIWKVWSFAAATGVTGMYGVGGTPPERRVLHWQGEEMTVDYPPVALFELAIAGRLYRAMRPLYEDSRLLTVAVKLPGLAAEILLLIVLYPTLRRAGGDDAARWGTLALWLNPAVWLDGPALGYLDPQMAVPLVLALIFAWRGAAAASGVLLAIAVLTKAQAIFVAPVVAALIVWRASARVRAIASWAGAGVATTGLIVLPFVARGAWSNLTQAIGRLATHDMLSAQAANVWWIFTWLLRVADVWSEWGPWRALTQETRILAITRATALGYPNARIVGLVLVGAALAWAFVRARRAATLPAVLALAGWSMYAYALFAAQVHENHLAPAVFLLAPAAALDRRLRPVFWAATAVVALNLYLFYGVGTGSAPIVGRSVTIVDATVLLAVASLATFAWLTARVIATTRTATA